MNKPVKLSDRKNAFVYAFWNLVNKIVVRLKFKEIQIEGRDNLPRSGPFILVANHISRWDGLLIYRLINRPANFMVSPNELKGAQGKVLISMGAFPAAGRFDLVEYCQRQMTRGEGVVIFPEGDIYRDGATHPFKNGAARIALFCAASKLEIPIVPCAVSYGKNGDRARIVLGEPVKGEDYLAEFKLNQMRTLRTLSDRLHREVSFLRYELGETRDNVSLFFGTKLKMIP